MALTFIPSTSNVGFVRIVALTGAMVRGWCRATIEMQQLRTARKVGTYVRNLDDQRLKDLGIERSEIETRFPLVRDGG